MFSSRNAFHNAFFEHGEHKNAMNKEEKVRVCPTSVSIHPSVSPSVHLFIHPYIKCYFVLFTYIISEPTERLQQRYRTAPSQAVPL
jgi:uncharacterized membrane protein